MAESWLLRKLAHSLFPHLPVQHICISTNYQANLTQQEGAKQKPHCLWYQLHQTQKLLHQVTEGGRCAGLHSGASVHVQPQALATDPSRLWTVRPFSHTERNEPLSKPLYCHTVWTQEVQDARWYIPGNDLTHPGLLQSVCSPGTQNQGLTSLMISNSSGVAAAPILTPLGGMTGILSEVKNNHAGSGLRSKENKLSQEGCGNFHLANSPCDILALVPGSES